MNNLEYGNRRHGILSALRGVIPVREVNFGEALRVAELQAARLLELSDVTDAPVPDDIVLGLPKIERRFHRLRAASGMTYWNGATWVIGINSTEPRTRQRFTLLHEYKHIIDHGRTKQLYRGTSHQSAERQAEQAADYFAGCVLVPKRFLKQAWNKGTQHPAELARLFDVSTAAIEVRLQQVGLVNDLSVEQRPDARAFRMPERPADWYFRTSHLEAMPCPS